MAIDPKLYEKYTGRRPGEAMNRMGRSLAKRSARGPDGDVSLLAAWARGRWFMRVIPAVLALIAIVYILLTM